MNKCTPLKICNIKTTNVSNPTFKSKLYPFIYLLFCLTECQKLRYGSLQNQQHKKLSVSFISRTLLQKQISRISSFNR